MEKHEHATSRGTENTNNFVKPHIALEGQTPADVAGIGVKSRDKWAELLKEAIIRR